MAKLEIKGLDKLEKALKENATLDDVRRVVKTNGAQLQQLMQHNADFTQGYQTGATKRSIGLEISEGGMTADVGPETNYSPYLEYGTRFMASQPFVRPAYEDQAAKFKSDMKKLTK